MVEDFGLLFSLVVFLWGTVAHAHKMGDSKWCLVFTTTHQECFYKGSSQCDEALQRVLAFTKKNKTKMPASEPDGTHVDPYCIPNPSKSFDPLAEDPTAKPKSPVGWRGGEPW